jgi:hypothetical protein
MPADTSVKYFHSEMAGAPTLNGTAGALITVLDACLVNGFGLVAVSSLVVSSNVATATTAGHSAEVGSVVLIAGATPGALNGEKKVLSVGGGNTTLTFDATGISDQTATGTISVKLAPAGWEKSYYSGTTIAVYKSLDIAGTGCYLRVNDANARYARAIGYETMTGHSTGLRLFPTSLQLSGGVYWDKSSVANATARGWTVASDGRIVYLALRPDGDAPNTASFLAFGDLLPVSSADAWACVLCGTMTDMEGYVVYNLAWYPTADVPSGGQGVFCARSHTAAVGSVPVLKSFTTPYQASTAYQSGGGLLVYPNSADGGLYLTQHLILQDSPLMLRGLSPGLYCSPQTLPVGWMAANAEFDGEAALTGRRLRVVPYSGVGIELLLGWAWIDSTGPWR